MNKYNSLLLILSLSACAVTPDYEAPQLPNISAWLSGDDTSAISVDPVEVQWWKTFDDSILNQLIDESAQHNHDIRIALASIKEAKAKRRVSASGFYPSIDAGVSAAREGSSSKTSNNNNSSKETDRFSASLDASWEPDIFGGVARETEAADARAEASEADYRDVLLSVFAEVSRNYFELRGIQKRVETTKRDIELLREVEKIAQSLFDNGATSEFDVALARGERESTEAELPSLEAEMMAGIYRLSVLTGKPPEHHLELLKNSMPLPMPPDVVPVGLKSDILRRRPDIRRAERELAAATADIGVATAELYPRFPITGAIGSDAARFSDLFSAGGFTYLIAQAVTMPLFQGGAMRANIAASDALAEQALAAYEKAVLTALEDAEASLIRYGKEWQTLSALQAAQATRQQAYDIAELRYREGDESFLVVLDAERSLTDTRNAIILSETRILTNLTQLYKSLGGGWEVIDQTDVDNTNTNNAPDTKTPVE